MDSLNSIIDFLKTRSEEAQKVIDNTNNLLRKQGWDRDACIAENRLLLELLQMGYKTSEACEIIKRMK